MSNKEQLDKDNVEQNRVTTPKTTVNKKRNRIASEYPSICAADFISGSSFYPSVFSSDNLSETSQNSITNHKIVPKTQIRLNAAITDTSPELEVDSTKKSNRKQTKPKKNEPKVVREIRYLQSISTNILPKAPFLQVVREIIQKQSDQQLMLTKDAASALQESAELYLTQFFADAIRCAIHRNRVTLTVSDMELTRYLRGRGDPGSKK